MADTDNSPAGAQQAAKTSLVIFCFAVIAMNTGIILRAVALGGWGAMGLLWMVAPVLNACCMVAGAIMAWQTGRRYGSNAAGAHWLLAFLLPGFGIIVCFFAINFTSGGC